MYKRSISLARLAAGLRCFGSTTPRIKRYVFSAIGDGPSAPGCVVETATKHRLEMDLPRIAGGCDAAPQPVELMIAALLGCKVATAHFVARHLWSRPNNRVRAISFVDVVGERDERGALSLPIAAEPTVTAALLSVRGTARVLPASTDTTLADVQELGDLVKKRCPVAATLAAAGVDLAFKWELATRIDSTGLEA